MKETFPDDDIGYAAQRLRSKHVKLLWDLTIYLVAPDEGTLEVLLDIYERSCDRRDRSLYFIAETLQWESSQEPVLTDSGRLAAAQGDPLAYLAPLRLRLRDARPFALGFWDGRTIDDPNGSRSFSFQGVKGPDGKVRSFVRFLLPLEAPFDLMRDLAASIAPKLPFLSGHGGLSFVYDPWNADLAFDAIYAGARRFWSVDIESLSATLPAMDHSIKGVSWLTMLGHTMAADGRVAPALAGLRSAGHQQIQLMEFAHGSVLLAGTRPCAGDRHRGTVDIAPQVALAKVLQPLIVDEHADFPGSRFAENGNTVGWLRRFVDPKGWS